MSELVLYDLPSKGRCACWSFNPWRTRLVLNYKGIPYKTVWLEYPELEPTFKSFGIPPNSEGTAYTSPTIRIGDRYVMDSVKIAAELEKQYPSPSLYLDSPSLPKVQQLIPKYVESLGAVLMPKIPNTLLNPASASYCANKWEKKFGMSLAQMEKERGGDAAWEKATPVLKEFGDLLRAEGGPFVLGKTVSYADFLIVGLLHFMKRIDDAIYERVIGIEPAFKNVYEASRPWLERDDH